MPMANRSSFCFCQAKVAGVGSRIVSFGPITSVAYRGRVLSSTYLYIVLPVGILFLGFQSNNSSRVGSKPVYLILYTGSSRGMRFTDSQV